MNYELRINKVYYFLFFVFCLLFIIYCFSFVWHGIFSAKNPDSNEIIVFPVIKGEGTGEISSNLQKNGLIKNAFLFRIYVLMAGKSSGLQAGDYELSPAMNIPEIADKLALGEVLKKTITIIEGWTVKDIEEYLKMGLINTSLEGYLFPDTYEILPRDGVGEIIGKMRANFDKKITPELKEEIISQKKTISEIVIMASLIEKEVRTFEDKKIVSGVLWKRLKIGMPLQVDAAPDTYKYRGLPPGPICNPGLESIKAAIYPEGSEYWYYLSTSAGKTIFSRTLEEHNIAKAKYLK